MTWHNPIVNFFRTGLPYDSPIRPYAKRLVEDARTLSKILRGIKEPIESIGAPPMLTIETTNICNADCVFCAYQNQSDFRKKKGVMPDELFFNIVDQYIEMGGNSFNLTPLVGEALVDPNIIGKINYIKQRGASVILFTNGTLFHRLNVKSFLRSGIDGIVISVSPFDGEAHKRIYRSKLYPDILLPVRVPFGLTQPI